MNVPFGSVKLVKMCVHKLSEDNEVIVQCDESVAKAVCMEVADTIYQLHERNLSSNNHTWKISKV